MAKLEVNKYCNVYTGEDTKNPRLPVEITIPRFRLRLSLPELKELFNAISEAVATAEGMLNG